MHRIHRELEIESRINIDAPRRDPMPLEPAPSCRLLFRRHTGDLAFSKLSAMLLRIRIRRIDHIQMNRNNLFHAQDANTIKRNKKGAKRAKQHKGQKSNSPKKYTKRTG